MRKRIQIPKSLLGIGILFLLVACASYQTKLDEPRQMLKAGRFTEGIEKLKALAEKPSDDQLVYLMELGSAYQMAGRYKESNKIFLEADRLTEQVDYHSVSNIAMATLTSEDMIQYKGDSFEKLFINANLALNFSMMGELDSALVEARRINEKITKFRLDGRPDYEKNAFADYFSGLIWEADQKFDDAYISFETAYKLDATNPYLPADLIRSAKKARRDDTYRKWKKEFPDVVENPDWYDKNKGEIVVVILQGWGPRKQPAPENARIPRLYPVYSMTQAVKAELIPSTTKTQSDSQVSKPVYNVERVAIQTLDADYGWLIARRVGSFVAKEVMADQIRQKNELLGLVAWLGMHLSDRADLRQWSLLPQTVQLARFWVPPGNYKLKLQGLEGGGTFSGDAAETPELQVKPGRKTFYLWRPLR